MSILGTHYLQPITVLLEKLSAEPSRPAGSIKTPYPENAYAASLCILSVVCFESCVMKLRFGKPQHHGAGRIPALEYFRSLHPDYPGLEDLADLCVLRDVLVHNHVWVMDLSWDRSLTLKVAGARKALFSGDKKYADRVNQKTRRTKYLNLHVVPIEVDRSDAYTAVRVVWEALLYIDSMNLGALGAAFLPVFPRRGKRRFDKVLDALPDI